MISQNRRSHEPVAPPPRPRIVAVMAARILVMAFASDIAKAPKAPGLAATIAAMLRDMIRDLSGTYRPERHYMRGPGPKWHEKRTVFAARPAMFPNRLQAA
jgi:hypothetical protein